MLYNENGMVGYTIRDKTKENSTDAAREGV